MIEIKGWIGHVDHSCERYGVRHAVVGHKGARPIVACGIDVGPLNWTLEFSLRGEACKNCARKLKQ